MISIEVKINDSELIKALQNLCDLGTDTTSIMRQCAGILAGATEDAFETQRDPVTGTPWVPLQKSTVAARQLAGHDGKILQLSGSLASSIERRYGNGYAVVGTNKEYAAIHQFGGITKAHIIRPRFKKALLIPGIGCRHWVCHPGSEIPRRRFLGIGPEDEEEIRDAIRTAIHNAIYD